VTNPPSAVRIALAEPAAYRSGPALRGAGRVLDSPSAPGSAPGAPLLRAIHQHGSHERMGRAPGDRGPLCPMSLFRPVGQ
jgi:hypothetical protein